MARRPAACARRRPADRPGLSDNQAQRAYTRRFTFHDLRAFYASRHKKVKGTLPDLHKNPGTTAKIYDRNIDVGRDAL